MGAVDVGIGHQDDFVVAQVLFAVAVAGAAAERLDEVGDLLVLGELFTSGAGNVEHLATQRQDGLAGAVARRFGAAAGAVALDDEDLGALSCRLRAVGELAGKTEFPGRRLAIDLFLLLAAEAFLGTFDGPVEELVGLLWGGREPMVEGIAQGLVDD